MNPGIGEKRANSFTPTTPRHSPVFGAATPKEYEGWILPVEKAPEHVTGRLNVVWGIDDGNVGSGTPFYACVGLGMLVHTGLAKLLAVEDRHLTGRTGLDEPRGLGACPRWARGLGACPRWARS